uniref:CCHC-type domain-containing protein n=1 Tax=Oryza sativa subsp. japonica TaxID=39947 RepID=Q6H8G7_ORYSJ|nr:hypothetical protein [Oryza sativa Japonica Group]
MASEEGAAAVCIYEWWLRWKSPMRTRRQRLEMEESDGCLAAVVACKVTINGRQNTTSMRSSSSPPLTRASKGAAVGDDDLSRIKAVDVTVPGGVALTDGSLPSGCEDRGYGGGGGGDRACYKCGKEAHMAKDCSQGSDNGAGGVQRTMASPNTASTAAASTAGSPPPLYSGQRTSTLRRLRRQRCYSCPPLPCPTHVPACSGSRPSCFAGRPLRPASVVTCSGRPTASR